MSKDVLRRCTAQVCLIARGEAPFYYEGISPYPEDWEIPIVPTAPRPPQQETVFARDIKNTHPVNASGAVIRNPR